MLSFTFNVLFRGLSFMPIIVGFIILYWSKDIFRFFEQKIKIIAFARTLPSPPTLPIIGNYQFISRTNDFLNLMTRWNRDIRETFCFWIGLVPKVVTTDPRDCEILLMNSIAVEKDLDFYMMFIHFMADSLLMGKGDATYRARKKLILPYLTDKYISNYIETFNKQSNEFVKVLGNKAGKGEFDIEKNVIHCIGDISFEILFGISGEAQQGNPDEILLTGTDRMMELMAQRVGKVWEYYDIFFRMFNKNSQEYFSTAAYMHKFVANTIKERKKKNLEEKQGNIDEKKCINLLDIFIDDMMKTNSWTDSDVKNQILASIVGIHDTLHGVLSFIYLMLAMHPEIQEKVRKKVIEVAGDEIIDQGVTTKMKYTQMVILETIRLFPITPIFPRKTTEELKLATCTLPKGTSILLFAFGMHRDPAHWTDPEIFNPERFTPENSKNRHKFAFVPFSNGLRKCPGYQFGLTCLKIIIADTIRHYKFSTSKKMEDIQLHVTISVRSTNGYPISVERLK